MYKDMIPNVSEMFMTPVVKANKLSVANLEKLVAFQMTAMQSYVDMGMEQLKMAVEVSNAQELQGMFKKQMDVAVVMRQKMLDDVKALTDMGNGFKDEFTKLAEENVTQFKAKAGNVVKKAA